MQSHTRPMHMGETIKTLRDEKGWTQEELGWRAGTSAANISRIETGKHGPGPEVLQALAAAFDLKIHELLALAEGEPRHLASRLPEKLEALLLENFRALSEERKLLLLQVSEAFVHPLRKEPSEEGYSPQ